MAETRKERPREEDADRLLEIGEEIRALVEEARGIMRGYPGAEDRAEAYWVAHVICAISRRHEYLGGSMVTLEDSAREVGGRDDE